jgi:electron transfer flavoprotein alpha subunit
MTTLIIAEHNNQTLNSTTQHVITAAQQLDSDIHILVAGFNCDLVATAAANLTDVKLVLQADNSVYQHALAENMADLIKDIANGYDYILAPATTFGKNILPRVAALLDVGQISDVLQIINADTFVRPIYAGNALATVQSLDTPKIMTIRTTSFAICKIGNEAAPIKKLDAVCDLKLSEFVSADNTASTTRPELTAARVVISGGRGLQSKENFKMLEELATVLNAAIGASRAAVDAGFVPNDYQVGQTGKVVAPELYIAIGISGAIQHLAGMKDSKVIVAINKDPDAPIFQVADYGLVGDLFTIVPELIKELS